MGVRDQTRRDRRRAVAVAGTVVAAIALAACGGSGDQSAPTTVAALSADELCRQVPATAVAAAVGQAWPRVADPSGGCRYQSATKTTSTVTITSSPLGADAWRAQATKAGGTVTDRDGVLVADYGGDGFGPLDELWWVAPSGATLVLRVDEGVTLDEALAIVDNARHGTPAVSGAAGTAPPADTAPPGSTTGPGATTGPGPTDGGGAS